MQKDVDEFLAEMSDVMPIEQDKVNSHSAARSLSNKREQSIDLRKTSVHSHALTLNDIEPVKPDDHLSYKQDGVQDAVFKNLRLGKYTIEAEANLINLSLRDSANILYATLFDSHSKGHRQVLIKHGKGEKSTPFPAYKKSYVYHWLRQIETVIAFHSATLRHGGVGSTYVLLKKHPNQKLINREQNRRR